MGKAGIEPARPFKGHWILSPACLPIPPFAHIEVAPGFEPGIMDLQSSALGHLAMPPKEREFIP